MSSRPLSEVARPAAVRAACWSVCCAICVTALTLPWRLCRPSTRRPAGALSLLAVLSAMLAGCGTVDPYSFPPACPTAAAVPEAADMTRFSDRGIDLTDMVLEARITGLQGKCSRDRDEAGRLKVTVTVTMLLARGPAAQGRSDAVDYFVAVTEGGRILVKDPLRLQVDFPPNVDRVAITGEPLTLSLPTSASKSGTAFRILAGLQLTPAQLAFNRRQAGH